jgi:HK97 family phage portal protein
MELILNSKFPFFHKRGGFSTGTGSGAGNTDMLTFDYWYNGYGTTAAGVTVNKDTALKQSAYWRAVNLLSSQIAAFPIGLFKRLPNGDTEEITDHTSVRLLKLRPNGRMNPLIWRNAMQATALVHGNGYSYIERRGNGEPVALKLMDATKVDPKAVGDGLAYKYGSDIFDSYYMLHIPSLSFDGVKGRAVLDAAAESMGVSLAMQKYSANFFKNGAKQSGVLMHPLALSDEARDGMRNSFNKKIKDKEGGTMVLDEGMKYLPLSIPPDQQQLLQSKQFGVQEIARWFGIPPHLLFEESRSTFNNISEQGIEFVRYTLTQWVTRWEAELKIKLLTTEEQEDHFFRFNMNSLMRGNAKDRFESYRIGADMGIYSINEIRRFEELNSIDGGDEHLVQLNRTPLGTMPEPQQKQ